MSEVQEYQEMTMEEKIQKIDESSSLKDLPAWALPPVPIIRPDTYFFISYSHLDYKKVYKDILELQSNRVNIWYDGGMPLGKDWKEVAEEYIRPYKCAGVIFYVSENSLMSGAIHEEMKYAKDNGKMCITINLPIESDLTYNSESVKGKEISAQKMLDVLRVSERNMQENIITDDKYKAISEMFGYNVLFMPYSTLSENKAEEIVKTYEQHKEPLLIFEEQPSIFGEKTYAVVGIKNIDVKTITISDFLQKNVQGKIIAISASAFANCRYLESIELPESVESIDDYAFYRCSNLKEINLPARVIYLGNGVFFGCTELIDITMPNSLHHMGDAVFKGCINITRISLPNGIESIGCGTFFECSGLANITIPDSVLSIGSMAFEGCSALENIIIPNSVTSIGARAFSGCSGLMNITIPNSVTSIENSAFSDCYKLVEIYNKSLLNIKKKSSGNGYVGYYAKEIFTTEYNSKLSITNDGYIIYTNGDIKSLIGYTGIESQLILPSGITEINNFAFGRCSWLTSITIPDSVTSIGDRAFSECSGLTSITISDSVTSIGDRAFSGCSALTSVTIPDNVTWIRYMAFLRCSALTSITIPSGITEIDSCAFGGCSSLTNITVARGNKNYHSEGDCLIKTSTKTLVAGCKTSVIPTDGSVTSIGSCAFWGCSGLTSITIPNGLTSIHGEAFSRCSGLTNIIIPNSVTYIARMMLSGCSNLKRLIFMGTHEEWAKIKKDFGWDGGTPDFIICCVDGCLRKGDVNRTY